MGHLHHIQIELNSTHLQRAPRGGKMKIRGSKTAEIRELKGKVAREV